MRRCSLLLCLLAVVAVPATASASDVIVQGTTDVRDAGLLDDVIAPGFAAAYPQYTLKYIAVGTGQALANARAGQGDAVLTHAPTQEATFVSDGFSAEPLGRAVFYSDYVILGPASDPAGVLANAPHDAVTAFERIAAAGAAGTANFVSRGDNSGTNTQEKLIFSLGTTKLNASGEPTGSWYHKAGLGQADTVKVAEQCPFTGGGCYEMTDRGTFNRLVSLGTITQLGIVSDRNDAGARGGVNLLLNPFSAYAVNPAKVPGVNVDGAKAFLDYLTSPALQARLATYPSAAQPALFADARPAFTLGSAPISATITAGTPVTVSGRLTNLLPGSAALGGAAASLLGGAAPQTLTTVATGATAADGSLSLTGTPTRSGPLTLAVPSLGALSATAVSVGTVTVKAKVGLATVTRSGLKVTLSGSAAPTADRVAATLAVRARRDGGSTQTLRTVKLRSTGSRYTFSVTLPAQGTWTLRLRYHDAGTVADGDSRAVTVHAT